MQYSQDLKEHLAAEKQIAAARSDEVAMAAIRGDPQILKEHLAICYLHRLSMLGLPIVCAAPAFPSQILVNCAI